MEVKHLASENVGGRLGRWSVSVPHLCETLERSLVLENVTRASHENLASFKRLEFQF